MVVKHCMRPAIACLAVIATLGLSGCKTFTERYIALEVWKYEKCFGHLPPGFVPPGAAQQAAAPPPRICGQANGPCPQACPPATDSCNSCQGGAVEGGMPLPAGVGVPGGMGGSPGPAAALPTPAGVTTGRPIVISDEVVVP